MPLLFMMPLLSLELRQFLSTIQRLHRFHIPNQSNMARRLRRLLTIRFWKVVVAVAEVSSAKVSLANRSTIVQRFQLCLQGGRFK